MIEVYLAGGMFCEGDRMYNTYLAEQIRKELNSKINLYVPQENASINDKTQCADSRDIFWGDYNRLQKTDVLIARIDGDIPPSGTSAEIGIMSQRIQTWVQEHQEMMKLALDNNMKNVDELQKKFDKKYKKRRPLIIGLCTDSRNPKRTYLDSKNELMKTDDYESQYCYFNLFTIGCIKVNGKLATSADDVVKYLKEYCSLEDSDDE